MIDDRGDIVAGVLHRIGQHRRGIHIDGTILAIDPATRTLGVSADDCNRLDAVVPVRVPEGFDLSAFKLGREVWLVLSRQPGGPLELTKALQEIPGNSLPPVVIAAPPTTAPTPTPPGGGLTPPAATPPAPAPVTAPAPVAAITQVEGTIVAIDGQSRKLAISGGSAPVTTSNVVVPFAFDLTRFRVGQLVQIGVTQQADGTLVLQRVISVVMPTPLEVKGVVTALDGRARTLTVQDCDNDACNRPCR
jgi:hypothetical protein